MADTPLHKNKSMNFSKKMAVAIAYVAFFWSEAAPQEPGWLFYNPAVSRLEGKLTKIMKYGKPSYGENPEKDEKLEIPILVLQMPIRVKAPTATTNHDSVSNVSFVQLIFPAEVGDYSKYLGRDIVVEGTLERGHKGGFFTDVVMAVKVLNPTEKPVY